MGLEVFIYVLISFSVTLLSTFYVFKHNINWIEMTISLVFGALMSVFIFYQGISSSATYQKIITGEIINKERVLVPCEHSYQDCTGDSCVTRFRHTHDYDWILRTTIGDIEIDRINSRGDRMPPNFFQAQIGEAASKHERYINYAKSVQHSYYHSPFLDRGIERSLLPNYPRVFNEFRVNRVLSVDYNEDNLASWNLELNNLLKKIGPKHRLNIVLIFVDSNRFSLSLADHLKSHWNGGEHNDVLIFVGKEDAQVSWVRVFSDQVSQIFNVSLEGSLVSLSPFTPEMVMPLIEHHVENYFQLTPLEDYDYLRSEMSLNTSVRILTGLAVIFFTVLMSWFFSKHNIGSVKKQVKRLPR